MKRKISFGFALLLMLSMLLLALTACDDDECKHSYTGAETKTATCESDGVMTYTCSLCTDSYTEVIKALGHDEQRHEAKAPTCTEIGWDAYVTCSRCDYTTYVERAKLGHTEVIDEAVDPDCTNAGLTEGKHCSVCNDILVAQAIVLPLNHDILIHDSKAPTCTEIGWNAYATCSRCDYSTYTEKPALTHDEIPHDAKAPTCTEIGWGAYVTCSRCDYTTYVEKAALTHDEITHDAKAPTCTEIGWDVYVTCSRCDYTTYAPIKETGHSHNAVVTKPTCIDKGYTTHTCHCGDTYVDTYVDALGHTEVIDKAVAPTCTKTGLTEGKHCSVCSAILVKQNVVPANGHSFGEWEIIKYPTESTSGEKRRDCANCNSFELGVVAPLSHDHARWETTTLKAVSPTCTETGLTEGKKCSGCGEILISQNVVSALGHTEVTDKAVAPTCTKTGLTEGKHCSVCNATLVAQNTVAALGHTEVTDKAVAPTCTTTGLTEGKHCSVCDATLVAQTIVPAKGHSYGEWYVTKQPTESTSGEKRRDCANCSVFETATVAPLSHDHSRWETTTLKAVAPTCTETGLTEGKKCSGCGEILVAQNSVDALGHKYNSVVTDPTCTEKGYTTHTCHCGDTYVDTYVDALGHNEVTDEAVAPTCTNTGLTEGSHCSACGEVFTAQNSIDALGHIEHNYDGKAATCTDFGWEAYFICDREGCGYSSYKEIAALGHDEMHHAEIPPTCQAIGYSSYVTCSRCDYHTDSIELPIVDHLFENYVLDDPDHYYCLYTYHRTAYCEYGCGEKSEMVGEAGNHRVALYIEDFVKPTETSSGYFDFSLRCEICRQTIDERRVNVSQPSGNGGSSNGKWYNNPLLSNVPYPDNFTVKSLVLDKTNDSSLDASCYGYAGGYFKANSTAQIQNYVAKLAQSKFSYNVSKTDASYIGYNSSGSLKLVVGFVGTDLTIMVYKVKDLDIESGSGSDHIHNYKNYVIAPTCTEQGIIVNYCYCRAVIWDYIYPESTHANCSVLPTIKPTCTESGLTQGRYCFDCGQTVVEQKEISALGHVDENGYCSRCNELTEYTVTFVADGNTVSTITYTVETDKITPPDVPGKIGHTGVWDSFELGTSSFTVEAIYTRNTYNINYVMGAGVNHKDNPANYTFGDSIKLFTPTTSEPLVIFGGWFTDPAFYVESAISEISPETYGDITLYAQWIYYRIETATGFEIDYNAEMPTLRIRVPSSSDRFDFNGKITVSKNCTWKIYDNEFFKDAYDLRFVPIADGGNLYYIVVFHPNGEYYTVYRVEIYRRESYTYEYRDFVGNVIASGNYDEDSELHSATPPVYDGFTFVGWSDGEKIVEENAVPDKNIVLTPVYSAIYRVEYYLENVDKTDYELLAAGEAEGLTNEVMTAEVIEIPHFTFNSDKSVISGSFSVTDELVLKVYYTRNTYTVSVVGEGGKVEGAGTYPYETNLELSASTNAVYYEFIGWYSGGEFLSSELELYCDILEADIEARFDVIEELKPFNFTYTDTTFTITGVKDTNVSEIIIPDYVTSIGSSAFRYCKSLTSVTIGNSVTTIGDYAFYSCDSLTSVIIGNSVTSIGSCAFEYCYKLVEVIDLSSLNITKGSSSNGYVGTYAKEVHKGESKIVNVNDYLFYTYNGANYLLGYIGTDTELVLPKNYNGEDYEIYEYAFRGCTGLTSMTIPDSITNIGSRAFSGCSSLTSITIGSGVTSIGDYAFYDCTSLTSVTIGNSVTSIGDYAFYNCTSLTSVTIGNGVTSIGYYAFFSCESLTSIKVDRNNTTYKDIDGNLYTKDEKTLIQYARGKNDTSFAIPNGVTNIGSYAFSDCTGLTSITIPNSVTSIGNYAFRYCKSLTSMTIGNSVTRIGNDAFTGCSSLASVTIPDSVTRIGEYAFYGCRRLTSIKYRGTSSQWSKITKGTFWDHWSYGSSYKINYTMTYNYTGE